MADDNAARADGVQDRLAGRLAGPGAASAGGTVTFAEGAADDAAAGVAAGGQGWAPAPAAHAPTRPFGATPADAARGRHAAAAGLAVVRVESPTVGEPPARQPAFSPPDSLPGSRASSAGSVASPTRSTAPEGSDDGEAGLDEWRFVTEDDDISPADIPADMRHDPVPALTGTELFAAAAPGAVATVVRGSVDLWHAAAAPEIKALVCAKEFMRAIRAGRPDKEVDARALGNAWKAVVDFLPALAPIALPRDNNSVRLRLLEAALRTLVVETAHDTPLYASDDDWLTAAESMDVAVAPAGLAGVAARIYAPTEAAAAEQHAVAAQRLVMRAAMAKATRRASWLRTVAGRLTAGWHASLRTAVISGDGGAYYFRAAPIPDVLMQPDVVALTARLTRCALDDTDVARLMQAFSAAAWALDGCGLFPGAAQAIGITAEHGASIGWPAAATLAHMLGRDASSAADDTPARLCSWLGQPGDVSAVEEALQARVARTIEMARPAPPPPPTVTTSPPRG